MRICGAGKQHFFGCGLLGFSKKIHMFFLYENQRGFHMRYHLFLHYEWFLQNLEKDFIRINMHTTEMQFSLLNLRNHEIGLEGKDVLIFRRISIG